MILNSQTLSPNLQIAIEVQRIFRPRKHGMDVVAHELLKRLPYGEDGFDYHVMVKPDADACLSSIPHRIIHTIRRAPYFIWEQYFLPKACRQYHADVLHCTANTAPLNSKVPLIVTLHDVIFLEKSVRSTNTNWYQRLGNIYRGLIVSKIAKKALKIITVSEFQRDVIAEKLKISKDKIKVVYNGADEHFFVRHDQETISNTLKKLGLQQGYIFFMANTDPRKNTIGVLKAYARLLQHNSNAPRLLMKGINREKLNVLLAKADLLNLEQKIDTIEYIDCADLPMIYQGASMLWFPSFSEGFGLPIVEAMASGTPVVTSSVSCMPEIAGDAALYVDPQKPASLAFAAHIILTDPTVAERLSAVGTKRAALFNWEDAAKKTVSVYHEVEKMIK
ncbi:glycosyltransferase family 4 protein [Mucilaginibacter celer]|uniref:Glycosyltransferase n=1 Tax=Mucilaginibacter celer TaxID=2305508 RepID=A0A494VJG1_9SPHI|nr:glycosyltransferase family 1 protein [Mucilaginibacter celer]AYL95157.1 glycosyltransferase [Mucilaginibacter celer]